MSLDMGIRRTGLCQSAGPTASIALQLKPISLGNRKSAI
ncbi:hypothetical protein SC1_02463 [Sphingopyxis sp. C-1]|nr:hypothetical protein SC1_02463 [Sphingopyxis sp. C-1]